MNLKPGQHFIDQRSAGNWSTLPTIYKTSNEAAKQITEWLDKSEVGIYRIRDYLGGVVWSNA